MRNSKNISQEAKDYLAAKVAEIDGSWQQKCDAVKEEMLARFDYVIENGEALRSIIRRISNLQEKIREINDAIPAEKPWQVKD